RMATLARRDGEWLGGEVVGWLGGEVVVRHRDFSTTQPPHHPTTSPPNHPTTRFSESLGGLVLSRCRRYRRADTAAASRGRGPQRNVGPSARGGQRVPGR